MEIAAAALAIIGLYAFSGNIRELRNTIERAMLMCDDHEILPQHLPSRPGIGARALYRKISRLRKQR